MPYREPLDVASYIEELGDDAAELTHVMTLARGHSNADPYRWPQNSTAAPAAASLCTDLARRDEVVWDANQYYLDLGIPESAAMILGGYARLTRRDILRAVKARGVEVDSARQRYCIAQLLKASVRADYNALPLGEVMFDDYWEEYFKRQAEDESHAFAKEGIDISAKDILAQWGLQTQSDEQDLDDLDWAASTETEEPTVIESDWDWSFYVWNAQSVNLSYLEKWQKLLHKALRQNIQRGHKYVMLREFAVGVMGFGNSPDCPKVKTEIVGDDVVFFIRNDVIPSKGDARKVIKKAIHEPSVLPIMVRD